MKCDACHKEIALAKVCPYCGHQVRDVDGKDVKGEDPGKRESRRTRGAFRGHINPDFDDPRGGTTTEAGSLGTLARFLFHPRIPTWRKLVALGALFYVLSPLDLLPGAAIPVLGWFDDMAVVYLAWKWIVRQLRSA